jgi:preprotein translocase subunit SecE
MGLIELIVMIVVIGVLLWLVNTYIPMDGKIKQILNITVVVLLVLFLLSLFLPLGQLSNIRIGK